MALPVALLLRPHKPATRAAAAAAAAAASGPDADVLGGALRGEALRFVRFDRVGDSAWSGRLCEGEGCAAISFLMVDPQTPGTDKILDFLVEAEPAVQELFAMLLASRSCARLPTDSAGSAFTPWCAHDEAGSARRTMPPFVIDAGANSGFYTLFSASAGARVVSIDPQPQCAHYVRAGAALSGFSDRVSVVNAFASARDDGKGAPVRLRSGCWGTFPAPDPAAYNHSRQEFDALRGGNRSINVPAVSLARVVRSLAEQAAGGEGVLIVKIDAEGAEDALIASLDDAGVLRAGLVKNFIVEVNSVALRSIFPGSTCTANVRVCYERLFQRFTSAGYVLLSPMSFTFMPVSGEDVAALARSVEAWEWMDMWWALPHKVG